MLLHFVREVRRMIVVAHRDINIYVHLKSSISLERSSTSVSNLLHPAAVRGK